MPQGRSLHSRKWTKTTGWTSRPLRLLYQRKIDVEFLAFAGRQHRQSQGKRESRLHKNRELLLTSIPTQLLTDNLTPNKRSQRKIDPDLPLNPQRKDNPLLDDVNHHDSGLHNHPNQAAEGVYK